MVNKAPSQVLITTPITRMEDFLRRNLLSISTTIDRYVSDVYDRKRMILVTVIKITLVLNTIRFGLSAVFNKVSLHYLYLVFIINIF